MNNQECAPMFCYQCEQAFQGSGCIKYGICGKSPSVSALQDLLIYCLKGLSTVTIAAHKAGINDSEVNAFICQGLFATVTNVDFDENRIIELINQGIKIREKLKQLLGAGYTFPNYAINAVEFFPHPSTNELIKQANSIALLDKDTHADVKSLKNTLLYGLKGMAAYLDHAAILGLADPEVYAYVQEALASMLDPTVTTEKWIALLLECGKHNLRAMELLDTAHNDHYGHPTPTAVPLGGKKGKAILISGHDLHDLEILLQQTADKGIFIYTHGEMLPSHAYPALKKYPHFYGHYGTAWQNQHQEFDDFPGAILMTTNCIQQPKESYKNRIFTTGLVAWPGVTHLGNKDFSPLIDAALNGPGFATDSNKGEVMVGFMHHSVLKIADKVIQAVKDGKIRHFFLVGGCDGAKPGRSYYTEFVEKVPKDCVVLTLACGKFRFFDKKLGDIDGIPRLLDIGQCNDAYSAIKIALALSQAFNVGVNELPLSLVLSWYEQKAVAILLTLLHLGIKNIKLGPTLPAFLSNNILQFLVEKYQIKPITTPDKDLKDILK